MKMLNLNKKALTVLAAVIAMLWLLVALPTALAWKEGSGWYINANYGGHYITLPLDIQIDGVSGDYQVFNVGDTVTITGDAYSYAIICYASNHEAMTTSNLIVTGPSGPDSDSDWHYEITFGICAEVDNTETPEARTITYPLTALGEHTVYMSSVARVRRDFVHGWYDEGVDASITFYVINPFTSVGECISTKIEAECAGIQGPERAGCVKEQIGYCHEMFDVSSAHTE